jgi:hypothetical protein
VKGAVLAGLLALSPAPAPAPAPAEPERAIESWTCSVKEQLDQHVSGMLQMMVYPDGSRQGLSYYVSWADQPGYIAEQQMNWIWIPLDATKLWKPDEIGFSVDSRQADDKGVIYFEGPTLARISHPAGGMVEALPTFQTTWVKLIDRYLVARLWAGWPWRAEVLDRKGATLGSQAILLPGPEASQAMFTRLRSELEREAQARGPKCSPNLEPSQEELERAVI